MEGEFSELIAWGLGKGPWPWKEVRFYFILIVIEILENYNQEWDAIEFTSLKIPMISYAEIM